LRITVRELLEEMPYIEFQGWLEYFDRRPVDWRDDLRAARLMQAQGITEKPENIFESLRQLSDAVTKYAPKLPEGAANVASLRNSALFAKLLSAKGGDNIIGQL
jgi:hypothetical protein